MREEAFLLPMTVKLVGPGRYLGRCRTLPGLNVEAGSIEEVLRLAPRVARALIAAMRDKGVALPPSLQSLKPPARVQLVVAA